MIVVAAVFALFHVVVVAVPVLLTAGAGESQAFAAAIVDLPILWLLGSLPGGSDVLYGSSRSAYIVVFAVGGTLMYAAIGALAGWGMHMIGRWFRAAT